MLTLGPKGIPASDPCLRQYCVLMSTRPAHLAAKYAEQFTDESVAAVYRTRPPYPDSLFDILESLIPDPSYTLLDLGCGTGEIAIPMSRRLGRVVALDPSSAMLGTAKVQAFPAGGAIQWVNAAAEEFDYPETYGLVVAAASLHWMEWDAVLARIAHALAPGGFLVLVLMQAFRDAPWFEELRRVIPRYSTNTDYRSFDLVGELTSKRLFEIVGSANTAPSPFWQPVDDYVESFHSRNGFSRQRMPEASARQFDEIVRSLVQPYAINGLLHTTVQTTATWGLPTAQ